jgi:hypothetical protein
VAGGEGNRRKLWGLRHRLWPGHEAPMVLVRTSGFILSIAETHGIS